jgi:hypothetical protein
MVMALQPESDQNMKFAEGATIKSAAFEIHTF